MTRTHQPDRLAECRCPQETGWPIKSGTWRDGRCLLAWRHHPSCGLPDEQEQDITPDDVPEGSP